MTVNTVSPPPAQLNSEQRRPSLPAALRGAAPAPAVTVDPDLPYAAPAPIKSAAPVPASEIEALRYDPVAIAQYYGQRPLQVWGRLLSIIGLFVSFRLSLWWDEKLGRLKQNQRRRADCGDGGVKYSA